MNDRSLDLVHYVKTAFLSWCKVVFHVRVRQLRQPCSSLVADLSLFGAVTLMGLCLSGTIAAH